MWVPPRKPVLVSGALTALLAQEITQTVPHVHIANPTSPFRMGDGSFSILNLFMFCKGGPSERSSPPESAFFTSAVRSSSDGISQGRNFWHQMLAVDISASCAGHPREVAHSPFVACAYPRAQEPRCSLYKNNFRQQEVL